MATGVPDAATTVAYLARATRDAGARIACRCGWTRVQVQSHRRSHGDAGTYAQQDLVLAIEWGELGVRFDEVGFAATVQQYLHGGDGASTPPPERVYLNAYQP